MPYPAGGATDVAARLIAERLEPALKKTVMSRTAPARPATSAPLPLCTRAAGRLHAAGQRRLDRDLHRELQPSPATIAFKDLVPVGGIGVTPTLLVTATANPPNDLKTLIEWGKSKPDGLTYSTAGYGLHPASRVRGDRPRAAASSSPTLSIAAARTAMTDLITGRVDFGSFAAGTMLPLIKEDKLKALAVIVADKRSALIPDVPTTDEQGLPGINSNVQFMVLAPAATPKPVIDRLSAELRKVVGDPALKHRFVAIGFEPTPSSSEEMGRIMRKTAEDWVPVIRQLNIKLD